MFIKLVYSVGNNSFLFRGYKVSDSSVLKTNSFIFNGNSPESIEKNMDSVIGKHNDYYVKTNLKEFIKNNNKLENRKTKYFIYDRLTLEKEKVAMGKKEFLKCMFKFLHNFNKCNNFFDEQYIHPDLRKKENLKLLKGSLYGKKLLYNGRSETLELCEEIKFKFLSEEFRFGEELEILTFKYDKDKEICTFY